MACEYPPWGRDIGGFGWIVERSVSVTRVWGDCADRCDHSTAVNVRGWRYKLLWLLRVTFMYIAYKKSWRWTGFWGLLLWPTALLTGKCPGLSAYWKWCEMGRRGQKLADFRLMAANVHPLTGDFYGQGPKITQKHPYFGWSQARKSRFFGIWNRKVKNGHF